MEAGEDFGDEGVEAAFDVIADISEKYVSTIKGQSLVTDLSLLPSVKTCKWIGDCFIYTNAANRLSYLIGSEAQVVTHFDK